MRFFIRPLLYRARRATWNVEKAGGGSSSLTLQHGVGLQQLLFDLVHLLALPTHRRHVWHHQLTGLWKAIQTHTHTLGPPSPPPPPPKSPPYIITPRGPFGLVSGWGALGLKGRAFHTAHQRPSLVYLDGGHYCTRSSSSLMWWSFNGSQHNSAQTLITGLPLTSLQFDCSYFCKHIRCIIKSLI